MEFTLNETKSAEALCRAKIKLIQSKMGSKKQSTAKPTSENGSAPVAHEEGQEKDANRAVEAPSAASQPQGDDAARNVVQAEPQATAASVPAPAPAVMVETKPTPSESIATGQSSAIALK